MFFETLDGRMVQLPSKPLLYREEIDIDIFLKNLHVFLEFFADEFDLLIKQIIPKDFIQEAKFGMNAIIDCFDLSPIEEILKAKPE